MTDSREDELGLGLKPGDAHYRAYVGPPERYDLSAAMTFNLLTTLGLRGHHTLLDIGCGSLRCGRLFIPYLNAGRYVGIEPHQWLVEAGIEKEVGADLIRIKRPQFYFSDAPNCLKNSGLTFDFAVAQSIFSHCGLDLFSLWLREVSPLIPSSGALAATFLLRDVDAQEKGWIYPRCVKFTLETVTKLASDAGFGLQILDWYHPSQSWGLFYKKDFDRSWFEKKPLSWNARYRPTTRLPLSARLRALSRRLRRRLSKGYT